MLRQQDSLGLSNDVADSIAILNKTYGKVIDSIWTPVAKYLASLPEKYDLDEAYDRVRTAENKSLDQMAIYGPAAKQLLTPEQVRKLPPFIALFLDNQAIRQVRPGRAGGGRGGFFGDLIIDSFERQSTQRAQRNKDLCTSAVSKQLCCGCGEAAD